MNEFILKELKIEVTYNCPLACVHCSSDANEDNILSITKEKCLEIIQEAAKMGVTEISFSGGEPLTWVGIVDAVSLASLYGIETNIYTSGNCNNADLLFEAISNAGIKKAIFSLYSNIDYEHDRVTRKSNSFNKTLESIRIAKSYGIVAEIHFVALATNYMKLTDIVYLAKSIGVEQVSVLRFVPQGRGVLISKRDTLTREQNIELIKTIRGLRTAGYQIRTGSPFNVLLLNEKPKCMAAQDRMIIEPNLLIFPCDAFKQIAAEQITEKVEFSSLENCSLYDCWENSTYLLTVRDKLISDPQEPCKSCNNYSICLSGCLAQKFINSGSLDVNPDPACLNRRV